MAAVGIEFRHFNEDETLCDLVALGHNRPWELLMLHGNLRRLTQQLAT